MDLTQFLVSLLAIFVSAKLCGELALRMGQPALLGELSAGMLIGPSLLGWLHPEHMFLLLAEVGVFVLLFEIGLETDFEDLLAVGWKALLVAIAGVVIPFVGGYLFAALLGLDGLVPIFVGATLTATSIGVTAKVLGDLGKLSTLEGRIIIGAAVADDVIGLSILAVVSELAETGSVTLMEMGKIAALGIGVLVLAVVVGTKLSPYFMRLIDTMQVRGALVIGAIIFALALGVLTHQAGTSLIIGAFAAGLVLPSKSKEVVFHELKPIADFFVPIFFVTTGASINLTFFNPLESSNHATLWISLGLVLVALSGKLVSGYTLIGRRVHCLAIGAGMVPRGEVGLIFAEVGRRSGAINDEVFAILVITVAITTFIAPILLNWIFQRNKSSGMIEQ